MTQRKINGRTRYHQKLADERRLTYGLRELEILEGTEKTRIARAVKMYLGCIDCRYRRHPEALQFDHRPGEVKIHQISGWPGDLASMVEEMKKCDVVCANCHAIRTAERRHDPEVLGVHFNRYRRRDLTPDPERA